MSDDTEYNEGAEYTEEQFVEGENIEEAPAPPPPPPKPPADPWEDKKDAKDPWRSHPLKGPVSVIVLLFLFYLAIAGGIYGHFKDDEEATWLEAFWAPAEFVRGFSGIYWDYSEWQIRSFEQVDELEEPEM
ncbi:MAG: hypothetical protein CMO80_18555 [Verrucomicrobiales bacterium]|nr:hypothetical protein [Verrucomicrobiales bacterium]|tara:strand:- start:218 stop:610 length:393 start_codon:yes stop_codon:yes gene_type:complete